MLKRIFCSISPQTPITSMFDYNKWRAWLQAKAAELEGSGVKTSFGYGPDEGKKPGMTFGMIGPKAMGDFATWVTGETDYTIMVPPSPEATMVSHKWGLVLTDDIFEATFNEFIAEFRKHDPSS